MTLGSKLEPADFLAVLVPIFGSSIHFNSNVVSVLLLFAHFFSSSNNFGVGFKGWKASLIFFGVARFYIILIPFSIKIE